MILRIPVVQDTRVKISEARNSLRADFRRFGAGMGTFKFYMMQNASAKPRTVASKSVAGGL